MKDRQGRKDPCQPPDQHLHGEFRGIGLVHERIGKGIIGGISLGNGLQLCQCSGCGYCWCQPHRILPGPGGLIEEQSRIRRGKGILRQCVLHHANNPQPVRSAMKRDDQELVKRLFQPHSARSRLIDNSTARVRTFIALEIFSHGKVDTQRPEIIGIADGIYRQRQRLVWQPPRPMIDRQMFFRIRLWVCGARHVADCP